MHITLNFPVSQKECFIPLMHRGLFSTRETGSLNQFEKADTHRTISSVCLCVNWNACEWNAHSSHPLRQHKNAFTRETKIVQASWRYCPIWPTKSHLHFSGQSTNLHKHTHKPRWIHDSTLSLMRQPHPAEAVYEQTTMRRHTRGVPNIVLSELKTHSRI